MLNVRKKAIRGIRWAAVEKGLVFLGSLLQLMIVVRHVEKSELGLMALVNTTILFAGQFSDLGLGGSIMHRQDMGEEQLSSLFWFYNLLGVGSALFLSLLSPLIALFFEVQPLRNYVIIAAASFLVSGMGQFYHAILYKNLRFEQLSMVQIGSLLLGFVIVVPLAILGYGIYALLAGLLARQAASSLLHVYFGRSLFRPLFMLDLPSIRFHITFGLYQTGGQLLNWFNTQVDTLLIGKLLGAEALGVYDVIKNFLLRPIKLINPMMTRIVFPVIAALQEDRERIGKIYTKQISYLCTINFPFYLSVAIANWFIIKYILSEEWLSSPNQVLFVLFCLYAMVYTVQNPIGSLVIARGLIERIFWHNMLIFLLLPPLIYVSAGYGQHGIVICMLIFHMLAMFRVYHYLLKKAAYLTAMQYSRAILLPLALAAVAFGPAAMVSYFIPSLFNTAIALLVGVVVYWVLNVKWNRDFVADIRAVLPFFTRYE